MKNIDLKPVMHDYKVGMACPDIKPNVTDSCTLSYDGEIIGFFLTSLPDKATKLAQLANIEFRSPRVPKTPMDRKKLVGVDEEGRKIYQVVTQMSTIIGAIPPKPHMRRNYSSMSSVHRHKSAQNYIKAMLMLVTDCEDIINDIMPDQFQRQKNIFQRVPENRKFGRLFTSSIANYNISAPFHQDNANIRESVNVIVTKRRDSYGGNLYVPDFDLCFSQCDNSLLVYPAWRNLHGVTPIKATKEGGYRNSLVFYPLKSFVK